MKFVGLLLTVTSVLGFADDRLVYDANGKYLYHLQWHPKGSTRDSGACDSRWQDSWDACARCKRGYTRVGLTDWCCTHGDAKAIPKKCKMDSICYQQGVNPNDWDANPCMNPDYFDHIWIGTKQYCCTNGYEGKFGKRRYYSKDQVAKIYMNTEKAVGRVLGPRAEKSVKLGEGAEVSVGGFCFSGAGERESGKCDRRKGVDHWDSCNRCVRGSRWSWFNHWCCTVADLQSGSGDCRCYYAQEGELGVGVELMNAQLATEFSATDITVYGFAVIGLVAIVGGAYRLMKKKNDQTVEFSEL